MTQNLAEYVAGEVRAEMARQRVSQRQLAAQLGLSQVQIQRRLAGRIEFRPSELDRAAELLGVPVTQLLPSAPTASASSAPASAA
jgi:transcriptional regulator with XRE-family HTH domain